MNEQEPDAPSRPAAKSIGRLLNPDSATSIFTEVKSACRVNFQWQPLRAACRHIARCPCRPSRFGRRHCAHWPGWKNSCTRRPVRPGQTVFRDHPSRSRERRSETLSRCSDADLLTRIEDWEKVAAVHGEFFRYIRPVNTIMQVSRFIDPEWLIEIETDAVIDD